MPKLPRITAAQIIKLLEHKGFVCIRQSGSHKIFADAKGMRATVPFHAGKILHPKVLKSIMKDANIAPGDLK